MKGKIFVISAPAGTGKTTLARMILEEFPNKVVQSISCTTRAARAGEINGNHYHFISKEEFKKKQEANEFLESAHVFDDEYGTLKKDVERLVNEGKDVLLVIDTQGAMQVKKQVDATLIFIKPPSMEVLKNRLVGRRTESAENIAKRLSWAEKELQMAKEYTYVIVNDDLNLAFEKLKDIIEEESCTNT